MAKIIKGKLAGQAFGIVGHDKKKIYFRNNISTTPTNVIFSEIEKLRILREGNVEFLSLYQFFKVNKNEHVLKKAQK